MKKSALFVDFDDSFSFNVIQKLDEAGLHVNHIHWTELGKTPTEDLLVLGPGPGHPDEYQNIFDLVESWIKKEKPFLGICLGHQILWRLDGADIVRSKIPKHGQKIPLNLDLVWQIELGLPAMVLVQKYNSLCVVPDDFLIQKGKSFIQDGEVLITRRNKLLTYQFHPESEGTSYPQAFFSPIIRDLV